MYFSGKYKLYGYKTEVSVRPNGLAVARSAYHPGSVADLNIMHHMSEFHEHSLEKSEAETSYDESDILHETYPNM